MKELFSWYAGISALWLIIAIIVVAFNFCFWGGLIWLAIHLLSAYGVI